MRPDIGRHSSISDRAMPWSGARSNGSQTMRHGTRGGRKRREQHEGASSVPFRCHGASDEVETRVGHQGAASRRPGLCDVVGTDHLGDQFAPLLALLSAVEATRSLRVGSFVLANDFRSPVLLAKEVATLDVLSGGRFELGLGAGWWKREYEQAGIAFDPASVRVSRMEEALQILKGLLANDPLTFSGRHYTVSHLNGLPKPIQRPHPPLLIGGGGKRVVSFAAREAGIVGLDVKARADGSGLDWTTATAAATLQKVEWIRQAAGNRFNELELNLISYAVVVTNDRQQAVQQLTRRWEVSEEQVIGMPHCLVGTVEQISDVLRERREQYGISYIVVPERSMEVFAPVVSHLTGT